MKMRPYQQEAVDGVFAAWREARSALVVLPTGCGKTVVFAEIARRVCKDDKKRVMVLAHREELVFQAKEKIHAVTGLDAHVEMGEYKADTGLFGASPVVVSTVQTHTAGGDGGGRMTKFNPEDFGLLIIDEAHHATAGSYKRCIDWYMRNPEMKMLGVTATPDRADEEALGQVFDVVAYDYEVMDAIRAGWLVPVSQQMVSVGHLDLSQVRTTAGDLNAGDLAKVLNDEQTLHEIAYPTIDICGDRRALVFAATVDQAERLCEIFNRHKPGCAGWLCGKTDKDERKKTLAAFKEGNLRFVCNVGVLTEGFDDDGVEVVVMARPTKSRSLYAQMAGRGTRPHSSVARGLGQMASDEERRIAIQTSPKPGCLIIDFCGNAGRHKLCCTADILGGNYTDEEVAMASLKARECGKPVEMADALDDARKELVEKRLREAAKRAAIVCRAKYTAKNVNPFDVFDMTPTIERGWDKGRHLTEKQSQLLEKNGISTDGLSYTQGRQLLSELFRRWDSKLPTFKQQRVLNTAGFVAPLRPSETKKVMDKLAQKWGTK